MAEVGVAVANKHATGLCPSALLLAIIPLHSADAFHGYLKEATPHASFATRVRARKVSKQCPLYSISRAHWLVLAFL